MLLTGTGALNSKYVRVPPVADTAVRVEHILTSGIVSTGIQNAA